MMPPRKETSGTRAYAVPLLWVILLIACYWLLADWPDLSKLLASFKTGFHWPA